jgi:hypothetical protein
MKFGTLERGRTEISSMSFNPGPGHYSFSQNPIVGDIYKLSFFSKGNQPRSSFNHRALKGSTFPKEKLEGIFSKIEGPNEKGTGNLLSSEGPGPAAYHHPLEKKKMDYIVNKVKDTSGLYLGATPNLNQKFQSSILFLSS